LNQPFVYKPHTCGKTILDGFIQRIQLEKETKEQILAAIEEAPGDDDNSSLISLQPSQSEVNIDVQKKVQNSAVVKAFNEAERKKASQS
ncbi:hypothetical protein TELCIR_24152, partial [Teladorsagia circumcincta]